LSEVNNLVISPIFRREPAINRLIHASMFFFAAITTYFQSTAFASEFGLYRYHEVGIHAE
jgi:hypothetical protein